MSIIKHKAQRVAVLIDVQNMYHSAKNLYNARVNFKEVVKSVVAGRELVRAIAYVIRTESGEEKPFLEALTKVGIETKIKDLQIFPGGMKKADWDVGMAIDAVRLADSFINAVILVSGDGDFVPLVEHLKGKGIQVEVVAFARSTSQRLQEAAEDFLDLGSDPRKFLLKISK
ncbi:MAG: NYN domain-containing protein [Candidatus Sungiibacteriota bacterium]|uniref:NYN domain-containing protein n=1 Tax=Candidatus Sungiibacteriota bacterium TaxID=2750080 RepID=A0A7T5RKC9_9BACT|nr:MAG: NYN domain-containing protein [Candidatus Sungbacteria bacterium]